MTPRHPQGFGGGRQRGGMAVTAMLVLFGLVALLGLVEIGYLYWAKRDVQKVADLAALAGAQRLDLCATDAADNTAARSNAEHDNGFGGALEVHCGNWSTANTTDDLFVIGTADAPLNAVRVVARRTAVPFFGIAGPFPELEARAIARSSLPEAAFTVGAGLLRVNEDAPLQGVLRLVGVDLSGTEIASYKGLANLHVTPRGLLDALRIPVGVDMTVGDYEALLDAREISVGDLLDAMVVLIDQQGVAGVDLDVLRNALDEAVIGAGLSISSITFDLLDKDGSPGLFAALDLPASDPAAGLDLELNALDVIGTAIAIAGSDHALAVNSLNLLGEGVQVQASIIEPPSIGAGPVGTRAFNSQVRLFVDLDTNGIPILGPVLQGLGTRLQLPLYVDVIDGYADLTGVQCGVTPRTASFDVTSSVANICAGNATVPWDSTRDLCSSGLQDMQFLTVLGIPGLSGRLDVPALAHEDSLTVAEGETGVTSPNALALGTTLSTLSGELLDLLNGLLQPPSSGNDSGNRALNMATQYLDATRNPSTGRYDHTRAVDLLRSGQNGGLPAVGDWQTDRVPVPCGLGLGTCLTEGSVWDGFSNVVTGRGGLLSGLTGLLGLTACNGLINGLVRYNDCVRDTLAYYLQTHPGGLDGLAPGGGGSAGECSGLLCAILKPVLDTVLRPILDGIGNLLSNVLADVLGLELGRTDVHVQSVRCNAAQLVR